MMDFGSEFPERMIPQKGGNLTPGPFPSEERGGEGGCRYCRNRACGCSAAVCGWKGGVSNGSVARGGGSGYGQVRSGVDGSLREVVWVRGFGGIRASRHSVLRRRHSRLEPARAMWYR